MLTHIFKESFHNSILFLIFILVNLLLYFKLLDLLKVLI